MLRLSPVLVVVVCKAPAGSSPANASSEAQCKQLVRQTEVENFELAIGQN
jgi:hypothetical protein